MNIVAHRKIFYLLSGLLILTSVIAVSIWGLKFGIDFTGGSILEVEFENNRPAVAELNERARTLNLGDVRFQPSGKNALLVRTSHLSEEKHQALLGAIAGDKSSGVSEKRFDAVGPVIGRELQRKSAVAVVLVILLIVSYIAFAFRKVSEPVASWKYGLTTVAALLHDVVIPVGFFALGGHFWGFEVDTLFITAVLTILGFSVHDTIVVFDRIRENLKNSRDRFSFQEVVGQSVSQTMTRSINTSLTVVLALLAVYFFGGESTKVFSLTIIIGIFFGTYSSIFIASPLLVTWHQWNAKIKNLK